MPLFTVIMRMSPPLVLAESMDNDSGSAELSSMRQQAKKLLETISRSGESSAVYTSGNYYFIHITENDVCYLTLCDGSYPKKLAYSFLEELKKEFDVQHGAEVAKTKRPFAFELFGTFASFHPLSLLFTLLVSPLTLLPLRHLHSKDQEALHGHKVSTQFEQGRFRSQGH